VKDRIVGGEKVGYDYTLGLHITVGVAFSVSSCLCLVYQNIFVLLFIFYRP